MFALTWHGATTSQKLSGAYREVYKRASPQTIDAAREVLPFTPYDFRTSYVWLKRKEFDSCLNVGASYGVFPEILANMDTNFVMESRLKRNSYLQMQSIEREDWLSTSHETLRGAGIDCVLISGVNDPIGIRYNLGSSGWREELAYEDTVFGTSVTLMIFDSVSD